MKPKTVLIEVWPNAWYLVIERMDKPALTRFGTVAHPDYPSDYGTWMCWARAHGPYPNSRDAFVEAKHYFPFIDNYAARIHGYETWAINGPLIDRHVVMALVANAVEPVPIPGPIEPEGFDALDQTVTCVCGNTIPLADMDEERGVAVVRCPGCRRSVEVDSIMESIAMAYGEGS